MKYFLFFVPTLLVFLVVLVLPTQASALQCSAQQTTLTFTSEKCYDTDNTYIGCSGNKVCQANGYCYNQSTTTQNWACPDTTSGSCSYSSTCDESGDITTTYSFCGSSPGSCASSSSTEYGACSRSTSGQSCGSNLVCSGGSCVSACVSNQGQACNTNACGQAGGTIQCNGSCSGQVPALPSGYGSSCTSSANVCGQTSTGTIQCNGTCSASTPSLPSGYGNTCTSAPNNVGETNTGTIQCNGSCSATAPADKTLSVSVSANPSSGKAPLKNVQITADVSGTATGTITYKLDCTNDLVFDATETSSSTSYTFSKKCDYDAAGTYTARVNVTRQTLGVNNTAGITVNQQVTSPSYPSNTWERLWFDDPKTNNFSTSSFLGAGPDQSVEQFDDNWGTDVVAYGKTDQVGFRASRTIDFTGKEGTYYFEPGADDGVRLYIDDELLINSWIDTGFFFRGVKKEITSGPHTFLFEYYENTDNAHVAFKYNFALCSKTSFVTNDSASVTIPNATGTKQCTVTIKYTGQDLTDGSAVKYETLSTGSRSRKVEVDDAPTSGNRKSCNDDLTFYTEWNNPASGFFTVKSEAQNKHAANDLSWGYTLETSGCLDGSQYYIVNTARNDCFNDITSIGENACNNPIITTDKKNATKKHGVKEKYEITEGNYIRSDFLFTLAECTQNSHCTDSTKAYCNGGATRTTSNFPLNTCLDSVAPTITVGAIKRTSPDTLSLGTLGIQWLKAGIYEISVTPQDNANGSGIDTSYLPVVIRSKGADDLFNTADDKVYSTTRTSDNKFNVRVGPNNDPSHPNNSTLNNCVDQRDQRCMVEVYARDLAGNILRRDIFLNIDFTPPTAQ